MDTIDAPSSIAAAQHWPPGTNYSLISDYIEFSFQLLFLSAFDCESDDPKRKLCTQGWCERTRTPLNNSILLNKKRKWQFWKLKKIAMLLQAKY